MVYGLTHQINTFDPLYIQFGHLGHLFRTAAGIEGFGNKVSVFLKGPGWSPGKPRLGDLKDIPVVERPVNVYNPAIAGSLKLYIALNFMAVFTPFMVVLLFAEEYLNAAVVAFLSVFVVYTCSSFGFIFDRKPFALFAEGLRLLIGINATLLGAFGYADFLLPLAVRGEILSQVLLGFASFFGVCLLFVFFRGFVTKSPLGEATESLRPRHVLKKID